MTIGIKDLYESTKREPFTDEKPDWWTIIDAMKETGLSRTQCQLWLNRRVESGDLLKSQKTVLSSGTGKRQVMFCYKLVTAKAGKRRKG